MVQPVFSYTDPVFSRETAGTCSLHLLLAPDGVGCIVRDRQGKVMLCQSTQIPSDKKGEGEYENRMRISLGGMPFLTYSYGQTNIIWSNAMLNLIPVRLFDPEKLHSYFALLAMPGDYRYAAESLPGLDSVAVFAVPTAQEAIGRQYFTQARVSHLGAQLLAFWQQAASRQSNEVWLNVRDRHAQMAVFEKRNLLYYNAFEFQNEVDALYFVLLGYEQFRMSTEDTPLILSGKIAERDDLYQQFARYIRMIRFAQWPEPNSLPAVFLTHQPHKLIDLLCLSMV